MRNHSITNATTSNHRQGEQNASKSAGNPKITVQETERNRGKQERKPTKLPQRNGTRNPLR